MRQIKLILLLASASVTAALAQSNGLTDMSRSRYARMVNTGIDAVHWTDGFWAERFDVFSRTSLQSMWNTWNTPDVSHGFRNFEIAAGISQGFDSRARQPVFRITLKAFFHYFPLTCVVLFLCCSHIRHFLLDN